MRCLRILFWLFFLGEPLYAQEVRWTVEYQWIWLSSANGINSQIISDIQYFDGTYYLSTGTGTYSGKNGRDWQLAFDNGHYPSKTVARVDGQLVPITVNGHPLPGYSQKVERIYVNGGDWFLLRPMEKDRRVQLVTPEHTYTLDEEDYGGLKVDSLTYVVYNQKGLFYVCKDKWVIPFGLPLPEYILDIKSFGNDIYVRTEKHLYHATLPSLIWQTKETKWDKRAVNANHRLVPVLDKALLEFDGNGQVKVLGGHLSNFDLSYFSHIQLKSIRKCGQFIFAISKIQGIAILQEAELFAQQSKIQDPVDGLHRSNGLFYGLSWNLDFSTVRETWGLRTTHRNKRPASDSIRFLPAYEVPLYLDEDEVRINENKTKELRFLLVNGEIRDTLNSCNNPYTMIKLSFQTPEGLALSNNSTLFHVFRKNGKVVAEMIWNNCNNTKNIHGAGYIDSLYWLGLYDSLVFIRPSGERVQSYPLRRVRSIAKLADGNLLVGSYGMGLHLIRRSTGKSHALVLDQLNNPTHLSGIGFHRGVFFATANSGLFYQDSAYVQQAVAREYPLMLMKAVSQLPYECNGGLFSPYLVTGEYVQIPSSIGVLSWRVPRFTYNEMGPSQASLWQETRAKSMNNRTFRYQEAIFYRRQSTDPWKQLDLSGLTLEKSDLLMVSFDGQGTISQLLLSRKEPGYLLAGFLILLGIILAVGFFFNYVNKRQKKVLKLQLASFSQTADTWQEPPPDMLSGALQAKFLQMLEHDLKGGMGVFKNSLDYLGNRKGNEDIEMLRLLADRAYELFQSLSVNLDEIMNLSRKEVIYQPLNELLEDIRESSLVYARLKEIQIELLCTEFLPIPHPMILKRVLQTVVNNAVKFSPKKQKVLITCGLEDSYSFIEVYNEGEPISESWNSLGSLPLPRKKGSSGELGMGKALKISSELMAAIGGYIELEPVGSKGTRAIIRAPRKP